MAQTRETMIKVFRFLDDLRENGSINMYGSSPVVAETFGLDRRDAKTIVGKWMATFGDADPEDRVTMAMS